MICPPCAKAADLSGIVSGLEHPEGCECTCQHRHAGSWKGVKAEESLTATKVPGIVLPS